MHIMPTNKQYILHRFHMANVAFTLSPKNLSSFEVGHNHIDCK